MVKMYRSQNLISINDGTFECTITGKNVINLVDQINRFYELVTEEWNYNLVEDWVPAYAGKMNDNYTVYEMPEGKFWKLHYLVDEDYDGTFGGVFKDFPKYAGVAYVHVAIEIEKFEYDEIVEKYEKRVSSIGV